MNRSWITFNQEFQRKKNNETIAIQLERVFDKIVQKQQLDLFRVLQAVGEEEKVDENGDEGNNQNKNQNYQKIESNS